MEGGGKGAGLGLEKRLAAGTLLRVGTGWTGACKVHRREGHEHPPHTRKGGG